MSILNAIFFINLSYMNYFLLFKLHLNYLYFSYLFGLNYNYLYSYQIFAMGFLKLRSISCPIILGKGWWGRRKGIILNRFHTHCGAQCRDQSHSPEFLT